MIPYDPATKRVFFISTQGAVAVGEASVAVKMEWRKAIGRALTRS
jgi:hypothetical protein